MAETRVIFMGLLPMAWQDAIIAGWLDGFPTVRLEPRRGVQRGREVEECPLAIGCGSPHSRPVDAV